MARHGRGTARRRPVRAGAAGRRQPAQGALIARRRTMPPPVNLPEMQLVSRTSLVLAEPPSSALN